MTMSNKLLNLSNQIFYITGQYSLKFYLLYKLYKKNMGSNQGVIWNDSDFTIQYFIYGKF